jgi:D-serine deaminase-like pyridoxal phosphate-dependent protein
MKITKPTFIVDKEKATRNITRMARKVAQSEGNIRFRPHFKTHQSAEVGQWFKEQSITAIAVSSVDMASYFAKHGWKDITIAVLVNPLQIRVIDKLAGTVDLNLLIENPEAAEFLHHKLENPVKVWIKIDTGYHRTGIEWNNDTKILSTAKAIISASKLHFKGILTHSGHSYNAGSIENIKQVYHDTVDKMNRIRDNLKKEGITGIEISIGDTPTCSVMDSFYGIDEVRCGNFVFYDVMQYHMGSCEEEDIAAAVACPVIGLYPQRNEIVIYGGAVHLSKDSITLPDGQKMFGLIALPHKTNLSWGPVIPYTYISSISQEHGIIKTTREFIAHIHTGDILMVLPIHSCLTAYLFINSPRKS